MSALLVFELHLSTETVLCSWITNFAVANPPGD